MRRHGVTVKLGKKISIPGRMIPIQAESVFLEVPGAGGETGEGDGQSSADARAKPVTFIELVTKSHGCIGNPAQLVKSAFRAAGDSAGQRRKSGGCCVRDVEEMLPV